MPKLLGDRTAENPAIELAARDMFCSDPKMSIASIAMRFGIDPRTAKKWMIRGGWKELRAERFKQLTFILERTIESRKKTLELLEIARDEISERLNSSLKDRAVKGTAQRNGICDHINALKLTHELQNQLVKELNV